MAAIASASASAGGPEWGQCFEQTGGKYSDSNCTTKAKKGAGTYEWRKAAQVAHKKFAGEGGAGILFDKVRNCEGKEGFSERTKECEEHAEENGGEIFVECTSENNHGEASGKNAVANVSVIFHGCKALGSIPCANTVNEEEIQVNALRGTLGYINKASKEVGVDLTPEKKKGEFAKFDCGGILGTVVGAAGKAGPHEGGPVYAGKGGGDGIISPITPVNEMSSAFTQVYTFNEARENIPNKFEGKPLQVLETYIFIPEQPNVSTLWSKAGESITNVNTPEEPVEIKA